MEFSFWKLRVGGRSPDRLKSGVLQHEAVLQLCTDGTETSVQEFEPCPGQMWADVGQAGSTSSAAAAAGRDVQLVRKVLPFCNIYVPMLLFIV